MSGLFSGEYKTRKAMKILALEREAAGKGKTAFSPSLLKAEARKVWDLQQSGIIREIYFRADRTDAHTRGIGAVVTARHLEAPAHVGICACFHVLDPGAVHTKRHLVLRLARR